MSVCDLLQDDHEAGIHRIDHRRVAEQLDPDQEAVFRKYLNSIQIGPDDEAFYRETRASYLINNYRSEKSEVMNDLAIAEKTGNSEEISRLAAKLIEIDRLIQAVEVNNA